MKPRLKYFFLLLTVFFAIFKKDLYWVVVLSEEKQITGPYKFE